MTVDAAIDRLGLELLRELNALAWFCDCSPDGKHPMIPSERRRTYEPGGEMAGLVEAGCIRLLTRSHCGIVGRHYPAVRMEQFGRQVLRRAEALRINLEDDGS